MSSIVSIPTAIGIIGGHGQFGKWCHALFERSGCPVYISDLGTELSNITLVERVDAIVIAVPIGVTQTVIDEIATHLSESQIVVDLTSVKVPFLNALGALPCEVLSLHPMFSPSIPSRTGQTCVVSRLKPGAFSGFFERLLIDEGMRLVFMQAEEHDRTMAVVQGLTHFQAIAAAHAMMQMGFAPETTLQVASPVYRLRLAMVGRILAQNPRLYAEIQIYNPYVCEVLQALEQSSGIFQRLVETKDIDGFVSEFERAREALGEFRERALEESNVLIQKLAEATSRSRE